MQCIDGNTWAMNAYSTMGNAVVNSTDEQRTVFRIAAKSVVGHPLAHPHADQPVKWIAFRQAHYSPWSDPTVGWTDRKSATKRKC